MHAQGLPVPLGLPGELCDFLTASWASSWVTRKEGCRVEVEVEVGRPCCIRALGGIAHGRGARSLTPGPSMGCSEVSLAEPAVPGAAPAPRNVCGMNSCSLQIPPRPQFQKCRGVSPSQAGVLLRVQLVPIPRLLGWDLPSGTRASARCWGSWEPAEDLQSGCDSVCA